MTELDVLITGIAAGCVIGFGAAVLFKIGHAAVLRARAVFYREKPARMKQARLLDKHRLSVLAWADALQPPLHTPPNDDQES